MVNDIIPILYVDDRLEGLSNLDKAIPIVREDIQI